MLVERKKVRKKKREDRKRKMGRGGEEEVGIGKEMRGVLWLRREIGRGVVEV